MTRPQNSESLSPARVRRTTGTNVSPARSGRWVDNHHVRPEIQALRALAVTMVVVYHLDPRLLPGGYAGVDVFFVISGFLITSHIHRGLASGGKFDLVGFYVRRIRRLLPAALLVVLAVVVVTLLALPPTLWNTIAKEAISCVFYVQNWTLAGEAVDYLAAGSGASPLQHFWSLSTEEQFYIFWPLLLWGAALLSGRLRGTVQSGIRTVVAAIVLISLGYSVLVTAQSPTWAYFVSPARAWELAAGGLLAITIPELRAPNYVRTPLRLLGLGAIAACCLLMNGATPFPGYWASIPVAGAILFIAAGSPTGRGSLQSLIESRSIQSLGDISYSVYLWHWPLIVLAPMVIGGVGYTLPIPFRVTVAAAAVPIAWLSKKFVEDPFRRGRVRGSARNSGGVRRLAVRAMVLAAMAMLVAALPAVALYTTSQSRIDRAEASLTHFVMSEPSCAGAAALKPDCAGRGPRGVQPDPLIAQGDATEVACQQRIDRTKLIPCHYGKLSSASLRVAVVGDSHANQWMPALETIARSRHWYVVTYFKSGCAFALDIGTSSCQQFNAKVRSALAQDRPDLVITSARSGVGYSSGASPQEAVAGFSRAWIPLVATGVQVIVLADTPQPELADLLDPPSCVEEGKRCSIPASQAFGDSALEQAAKRSGAQLVDMRQLFCRNAQCPSVIGGVLVYRDSNHMTSVYARTLAEPLSARLGPLVDDHR